MLSSGSPGLVYFMLHVGLGHAQAGPGALGLGLVGILAMPNLPKLQPYLRGGDFKYPSIPTYVTWTPAYSTEHSMLYMGFSCILARKF